MHLYQGNPLQRLVFSNPLFINILHYFIQRSCQAWQGLCLSKVAKKGD